VRVNGRIRAREVRVIGPEGNQMGVMPIQEAMTLARNHGVDLVEVASSATPPVCRLVDFGKYRYEQSKKTKESNKHHHANKVKEVQLSPRIDAHDFGVKLSHAIDFLCDEMKVKITLKFRGREMAHQEFGFKTVQRFLTELTPYGHPDFAPKLIGRGLNVMVSPLPRAKRAKNPRQVEESGSGPVPAPDLASSSPQPSRDSSSTPAAAATPSSGEDASGEFSHTPFANLDLASGG